MQVIPLIPSLNPDEKLIKYVNELIDIGFNKIIVVNDGSSSKYDKFFNELSKKKECIILRHAVNQGKGRALKTGLNYYLNEFKNDYVGVVTADSDGQHSPKDTLKVAQKLEKNKHSLILGTRNFNEPQVPFKSRNGNKITTFVFKLLNGKKINDTQTGLRGISNDFAQICLSLYGEKFDYEINMLISAVKNNVDIKEVLIDTIYIEENKSSHFNPFKDSIKIYKVLFSEFLKFTFTGLFSFAIDILLFTLFVKIFDSFLNATVYIIISTILARVISSLINYTLNKNIVFNSNQKNRNLIIKYYTLCIVQMACSALFVSLLFKLNILSESICKIIVDFILFIISYNIQKKFIFKK